MEIINKLFDKEYPFTTIENKRKITQKPTFINILIHLKSYPILVFKCSLSLFLYMVFNLLLVQREKL